MDKQQFINQLTELEVFAEMLESKASTIRKEAHKARMKLAGVSTPAVRKGFIDKGARAVLKRNKRVLNGT